MRQVVVSEARTAGPAYHHPSPRTPRSAPAANPRRSRRRPSRRAGRDASAFDTYVSSAGLNLNPSGRPVTDTPTAIPPGHHVIWSSPAADRATYMQQRMLYGAHPWRSAQPPATGAEAGYRTSRAPSRIKRTRRRASRPEPRWSCSGWSGPCRTERRPGPAGLAYPVSGSAGSGLPPAPRHDVPRRW